MAPGGKGSDTELDEAIDEYATGTRLHESSNATYEQALVLRYWLAGDLDKKHKKLWFPGKREIEQVDAHISEEFGYLVEQAAANQLYSWEHQSIAGTVALIILLDQMSRHVFRHQPDRINTCDSLALPIAHRLASDTSCAKPFVSSSLIVLLEDPKLLY